MDEILELCKKDIRIALDSYVDGVGDDPHHFQLLKKLTLDKVFSSGRLTIEEYYNYGLWSRRIVFKTIQERREVELSSLIKYLQSDEGSIVGLTHPNKYVRRLSEMLLNNKQDLISGFFRRD